MTCPRRKDDAGDNDTGRDDIYGVDGVKRKPSKTGKGKEIPEANPPGLVARVRIVSIVQQSLEPNSAAGYHQRL